MAKYISLLFLITLVLSCHNDQAKGPDVSHIKGEIAFIQTEKQLLNLNSTSDLQNINQAHPEFYNLYFDQILPLVGKGNPDSLYASLEAFVKDTTIISIYKKIDKNLGDLSKIKGDINQMFKYIQFYFPEYQQFPSVYTFISEYAYQVFLFEDKDGKDGIGIGLDMFLSPDVDYKILNPDNTSFSDYITRTWTKENIVKKVSDLYVSEIVGELPGHRMIDQMIYNGKSLYISNLILPGTPDSIIHEYTSEQMAWCYENELQIWSFFFDEKLFYESNPTKIGKYILPSPSSPDMPQNAPGRTANFIGWQIVKAYMDKFPETTIQELINLNDSQYFMEKSKYKPKRK